MKPANIAPFYGCLYPGLCDIARKLGYAMSIHGSMVTDLDLVAIPWTDAAVPADELVAACFAHLDALDYRQTLTRDVPSLTPEQVDRAVESANETIKPEVKPHGRLTWNLYLQYGAKVDLSVMPRVLPA